MQKKIKNNLDTTATGEAEFDLQSDKGAKEMRFANAEEKKSVNDKKRNNSIASSNENGDDVSKSNRNETISNIQGNQRQHYRCTLHMNDQGCRQRLHFGD